MKCRKCGNTTLFKALQWRETQCEVTLDGQGNVLDCTTLHTEPDGEEPYNPACANCYAEGIDIEEPHYAANA